MTPLNMLIDCTLGLACIGVLYYGRDWVIWPLLIAWMILTQLARTV